MLVSRRKGKLSTEILCPIKEPSLIYPKLYGVKYRIGKDDLCKKCNSTNQISLRAKTETFDDFIFKFICEYCGNEFIASAKLIINETLEDQMNEIHNFTKETDKEFGALIIRDNEGDIILDMIRIGKDREIELIPTHDLREGEEILGTFHCHPISDYPSLYDIATFLRDDWEKISMVSGVEGNFNVMLKNEETEKVSDVALWLKENEDFGGEKTIELGDKYGFLFYRGKADKLILKSGDQIQSSSLEEIFEKVKGVKSLVEKIKKGKKGGMN